jgi:hypothetical protein
LKDRKVENCQNEDLNKCCNLKYYSYGVLIKGVELIGPSIFQKIEMCVVQLMEMRVKFCTSVVLVFKFLITVELLGLISNIVLEVIQRKLFQVVTPSTTTDGNIGPDAIHLLAIKEVCLLLVSYVLLCTNRMSIFDCVLNLNLLFT